MPSEPVVASASEMIACARSLIEHRLAVGTAGNVSVRTERGLLVTPSAVPYEILSQSDLVEVDLRGAHLEGEREPSTEWPFHAAIYRCRPEIGGVVHAHPPYATALSCHSIEIPPFHYMILVAGGSSIRCAPYALPGSEALAEHVVDALADRRACLLAHHGMIAVGETVTKALALALEVEALARHYWLARQLGEPPSLAVEELEELARHFERYGRNGTRDA